MLFRPRHAPGKAVVDELVRVRSAALAADPMTAHLFRVYRSWFEHHWKHGTKLCAS